MTATAPASQQRGNAQPARTVTPGGGPHPPRPPEPHDDHGDGAAAMLVEFAAMVTYLLRMATYRLRLAAYRVRTR